MLLKMDEHVVKCCDHKKDRIDKTSRWRLTFPTSFSVKKKVSYSQKKQISVKKSQGKVKKKSIFLTFP